MRLKNYQEDLVLHAVDIALEDYPELKGDDVARTDIAAYVLNRLPPRYITSERGFTRLATEEMEPEQEQQNMARLINVLMLVNDGIELLNERRPPDSDPHSGNGHERVDTDPAEELALVHNFPQIVGKVVDAETGDSITRATVTLLRDDEVAHSADAGWPNPFVTAERTFGYFSFWPAPIRDEREKLDHRVLVVVDHPDYEQVRLERDIKTTGDFGFHEEIDTDGIVRLDSIELSPR
jgi:competence protein ComFB